jgi:hypothetical protein
LISAGYSPSATLFLFITASILVPLPFLFSLCKVKGKMVAGGSNSLVISAACHCYVSPHEERQQSSPSPSQEENTGENP